MSPNACKTPFMPLYRQSNIHPIYIRERFSFFFSLPRTLALRVSSRSKRHYISSSSLSLTLFAPLVPLETEVELQPNVCVVCPHLLQVQTRLINLMADGIIAVRKASEGRRWWPFTGHQALVSLSFSANAVSFVFAARFTRHIPTSNPRQRSWSWRRPQRHDRRVH